MGSVEEESIVVPFASGPKDGIESVNLRYLDRDKETSGAYLIFLYSGPDFLIVKAPLSSTGLQ